MGPKVLKILNNNNNRATKTTSKVHAALFVVVISFLIYNIYQAIVTTIFLYEFSSIFLYGFPPILTRFVSSLPTFQLTLLLLQEAAASAGIYLRLIGGIFALQFAWLFINQNRKYLKKLNKILLLEALHFLLFLPAGINHIVGSALNPSEFFNFYTGISYLLQPLLIFPPLFILSRKLKQPEGSSTAPFWMGISGIFYIFGLWIEHAFLWIYALQPSGNQPTNLINNIGLVNSWATLLLAGIIAAISFLKFRQNNEIYKKLVGITVLLVGLYFIIYALVAIWVPIYFAFLPLTELWLTTLIVPAVIILLNDKGQPEFLPAYK